MTAPADPLAWRAMQRWQYPGGRIVFICERPFQACEKPELLDELFGMSYEPVKPDETYHQAMRDRAVEAALKLAQNPGGKEIRT